MTKLSNQTIYINTFYKVDLIIHIGDDESLYQFLIKKYGNKLNHSQLPKEYKILEDRQAACTQLFNRILIRIDKDCYNIPLLCHELLHATFRILDIAGINNLTNDTEEAYTYLFQNLLEQILEQIHD